MRNKVTDYAGYFIYEKTGTAAKTLAFMTHPEGYVENTNGSMSYMYQYKDHLGNIRLSYSDKNGNGSITNSEILEENNYYPFGLEHKGYNNVVNATVNHFKDFQGPKLAEDLFNHFNLV